MSLTKYPSDKCTWIWTSIFKHIIPVSPLSVWCNTETLKRLDRSKWEPDTLPAFLCQSCYDIVWMLVETNHLGLMRSSSIGKHRQRGSQCLFCLCIHIKFSCYLECTSCPLYTKTAAFPKPDPGICAEWRGTREAQTAGPRDATEGSWEETDGQEWRGV